MEKKLIFGKNMNYQRQEETTPFKEMEFGSERGRAVYFATVAHQGQFRKFKENESDEDIPYITHPIAVSKLVHKYGGSDEMVVAALLHDVVEDTDVTIDEIYELFGEEVGLMVFELTDEFTHEAYPEHNRKARKALERQRMRYISQESKIIKLCDFIHNTGSIMLDKNFSVIYLKEKALTLTESFFEFEGTPLYEEANSNL